MSNKIRMVHYLNQFFAGIGREEKANIRPRDYEGVRGPGKQLQKMFGDKAEIVGTVLCGDSYFGANMEEATKKVIELIDKYDPDIVVAGPAFRAGRYGTACATVAAEVPKRLNIPAITAMNEENPGVDLHRHDAYIIKTGRSASFMEEALSDMKDLLFEIVEQKEIPSDERKRRSSKLFNPEKAVAVEQRKNVFAERSGARRAIDMLIKKMKGGKFQTELPMPTFEKFIPMPPVSDLSQAKIALVTSGGIVPKGNPDRLEASSATKILEYSIKGVEDLTSEEWQTAHGGYDPTFANKDPDRVLPVDVLRELEKEGEIGELYDKYYVTVGNGTPVDRAKGFAKEVSEKLKGEDIDAIVITSCCGTCQRCGATLSKTLEKELEIPVVQIAATPPIPKTVGANRIVPGVAIPHPVGDPTRSLEKEIALRKRIVQEALKALQTEIEEQTIFEKIR